MSDSRRTILCIGVAKDIMLSAFMSSDKLKNIFARSLSSKLDSVLPQKIYCIALKTNIEGRQSWQTHGLM